MEPVSTLREILARAGAMHQTRGRPDLTENTEFTSHLSARALASLTLAHSPDSTGPFSQQAPATLACTSSAWLGWWSLVYRERGLLLALTSRTKKNSGPSKAKQKQTSLPWISAPLWATACRPLVLHRTTFKIAFVNDRHSGHFCVCVPAAMNWL